MVGRLEGIGRLEIRLFNEQPAHLGEEEDHDKEDEEENTHAQQVMHRVIGMERYTIFGNAVFVLVLLDINTVRVVGANFVQRKNVQHHQTKQNDW